MLTAFYGDYMTLLPWKRERPIIPISLISGMGKTWQVEMKNACKEQRKYIFWMLVCAELFMSFSFLGYIHI